MNLAYFTCYFGGDYNYSKMIPTIPSEIHDCYYFTNNPHIYNELEKTKYIRVFVDTIPIYNDWIKDTESTKELRSCPHRFEQLHKYKYVCWHDSKLNVFEDKVLAVIQILDSSNKVMAITKHPYSSRFTSVWDEYNLCMGTEKYGKQKDQYTTYIKNKIEEGFSENISIHYCLGFRLLKQGDLCKEIGDFWYKNIKECGIEDQISFDFVVQKYGDYIQPLEYKESWKYCFE